MKFFTRKESSFPIPMAARGKAFLGFVVFLLAVLESPSVLLPAEKENFDGWAKVVADTKADTAVRIEAARKLGETKNTKYLQVLADQLKDGRKAMRWAAAEALWDLGDKRAVPHLIEYLGKGEAYEWGKVVTMNALASLGDRAAVEPLLKVLEAGNPFLRRSAALALVRFGDDRAIGGLIKLLKDEEGWLQRLAEGLLVELAKGQIQGEIPRGYEEWLKWHESNARYLKIQGVKRE